ncbi:MAG TPA: hypothetical protein VGM09_24660 [Bradyrhizobium sp.]|jgi:hypothetical protein
MIRTPNWNPWTRRALVVAILTFASAAVYLSLGVAQPEPVASAALSGPWQCTRTAGILTICTKKPG